MRDEIVSEVILPLCKGELEGVDHGFNMVYPPQPSLTKGGNDLRNVYGSISSLRKLFPIMVL